MAEATGETADCGLHTNNTLAVIATVENKRANPVSICGSETLPFHATAAGLEFLAFAARAMTLPMLAFSRSTMTTQAQLTAAVTETRRLGFTSIDKSYEGNVCGSGCVTRKRGNAPPT